MKHLFAFLFCIIITVTTVTAQNTIQGNTFIDTYPTPDQLGNQPYMIQLRNGIDPGILLTPKNGNIDPGILLTPKNWDIDPRILSRNPDDYVDPDTYAPRREHFYIGSHHERYDLPNQLNLLSPPQLLSLLPLQNLDLLNVPIIRKNSMVGPSLNWYYIDQHWFNSGPLH
jgi:hypothetical protein